jgi:nucleoside-diphosphate-sugar epimerase
MHGKTRFLCLKGSVMTSRALIAGVTGLIGGNPATHLVSKGWEVHGIARKPQSDVPGVRPIAADLLELEALRASLAGVDPTHVFITTWVRRASEEENVAANGALVRNLLAAVDPSESLRHVALVTGLKHYLGPFEYYAKAKPDTPLREEMPIGGRPPMTLEEFIAKHRKAFE